MSVYGSNHSYRVLLHDIPTTGALPGAVRVGLHVGRAIGDLHLDAFREGHGDLILDLPTFRTAFGPYCVTTVSYRVRTRRS